MTDKEAMTTLTQKECYDDVSIPATEEDCIKLIQFYASDERGKADSLRVLRAHVQKEVERAKTQRCIVCKKMPATCCPICFNYEKQQAVEKAMAELRVEAVRGMADEGSMWYGSAEIECLVGYIDYNYPNAKLSKSDEKKVE